MSSRTRQKRHDLFLCHSNKDKRFVRRLAKDLKCLAIRAWFDEWELSPADSLHESIGKALEKSAYIGIVLSPHSLESHWCKKELCQALARETRTGKKTVIPLRYRRCKIPAFLEDKLYIDFTRSYIIALAELVCFLRDLRREELQEHLNSNKPCNITDLKHVIAEMENSHLAIIDSSTTLLEAAKRVHNLNLRSNIGMSRICVAHTSNGYKVTWAQEQEKKVKAKYRQHLKKLEKDNGAQEN